MPETKYSQRRAQGQKEPFTSSLPFVTRQRTIVLLSDLAARRKHVLILGPEGVGKSLLLSHVRDGLRLLVSLRSNHLGEICDQLEPQLSIPCGEGTLLERKQRLRRALWQDGRAVAFDGVGWGSPKVSSFLESIAARAPVWICTRSQHPWDIGHFWPMLCRFERVEVHPFRYRETQELVVAAVKAGKVPQEALSILEWLHRRSGGNPLLLGELLRELADRHYDLSNPNALRLLDLDRRIHEVFPTEVNHE
jgi:hypothetical protein